MAYVYNFGKGYYGLETEGVTVSKEVSDSITHAFETAMLIPDAEIKIMGTPMRSRPQVSESPFLLDE